MRRQSGNLCINVLCGLVHRFSKIDYIFCSMQVTSGKWRGGEPGEEKQGRVKRKRGREGAQGRESRIHGGGRRVEREDERGGKSRERRESSEE